MIDIEDTDTGAVDTDLLCDHRVIIVGFPVSHDLMAGEMGDMWYTLHHQADVGVFGNLISLSYSI